MLRKIRIFFAVLLSAGMTFYFLDFTGWLPQEYPNFARIQFIPALLAGSLLVVGILLVLTWLGGRIYCSLVCPLGIFQDVCGWLARKMQPKKRYAYRPERRWWRWGIGGTVVLMFCLKATFVLSLLEPYSAYGRMAVHVFRPVYQAGNNVLAAVLNHWRNYTLYHTDIYVLSFFSLGIGLLTFTGIGFIAYRYGREWCNTVCPVGTLLGFISRYALWKVRIQSDRCVSCGLCERKCKASCIDSRAKMIDYSRCVACYDCLDTCHQQALRCGLKKKTIPAVPEKETDTGRRQFVSALATATVVLPQHTWAKGVALTDGQKAWQKEHPLSPPGSVSAAHLLQHCTACHLCIAKCPSHVLQPAFMEYGLGGIMQPKMDFTHGFCNFDCTVCTDVCPNGALLKLTKAEKHRLQVGRVVFVRENCIVYQDETSCGACSEHCPTQAVSMQPYKNGLTIPQVNPDICVGCGGCEYVCPVRPFRAIYIEGNAVHQEALPFKEAEKKELQLDDFGF